MSPMVTYGVLCFPLLLLLPLLFLLRKQTERRNQQVPRSPPKLPFIGNLHQLGALPHQSFWRLSKEYGPLMFLKYGCIPALVVSSAEAARQILKTHDLDCCSRPPRTSSGRLTYNYLDTCFSPYGSYWRELRKLSVLELFSLKRVQSFRFMREEEVAKLMSSISQSSSFASPVNLGDKAYALASRLIFRAAFGGVDFDENRIHALVNDIESLLGRLSAEQCFPYVGRVIDRLTGYHAKLERVFHQMDTLFQQLIDEHLKPGRDKEHEDIIDVLLKVEKEQNESDAAWVTQENIKALLLNLLLGGIDTGAIAITWAMAELARNPRIMKKAQAEIRNAVGKKGKVTEDDIDQLQYLKMVTKETLRLHPPLPLIVQRESMSKFEIDGLKIEPKTTIHVNVWAIGRDPKHWKDPEDFYPERFADSCIDFRGQHFEFLTFGSGRRICPAMNMGIKMVEIALANLLYCFDWKLPNGMREEDMNMEEAVGHTLTLGKKIPLRLVPIKYL